MNFELLSRMQRMRGKRVIIFKKNTNFRIEGDIVGTYENFVEIFDVNKKKNKLINVDDISEVEEGK